jgi:hypothetical protein
MVLRQVEGDDLYVAIAIDRRRRGNCEQSVDVARAPPANHSPMTLEQSTRKLGGVAAAKAEVLVQRKVTRRPFHARPEEVLELARIPHAVG